ncbi:MAG TPA: hypothetical protein VGV90_02040, partial [Solirubrobacteraceae bacterium]|nr:hypothetical protein [Solirubrobacteraceae bacterium]
MRRPAIIVATVLTLALAACGEDDEDTTAGSQTSTAAAAADPDRYCALTRELDAEGERFFAGLGQDATPQQYEAAERRFVTRLAGKLEELEQAAPQAIKRDVATLLGAQRERAGLPTAAKVEESEGAAAETRIQAWEKRNC